MPTKPPTFNRSKQTKSDKQIWVNRPDDYDHEWSKLRAYKLKLNPLCERCETLGRVTGAKMVHHIVPISVDRTLRLRIENTRALCYSCHGIVHGVDHD